MHILLVVLLLSLSGVKLEEEYFYCSDGAKIVQSKHCNGEFDCKDESDEDPDICDTALDEFRCDTPGEIISVNKTCDGKLDCSDGSDEFGLNCIGNICKDHQFRCAYGGCIDKQEVCDGVINCIDGSDEQKDRCISSKSICKLPSFDETKTYKVLDCPKCKPGEFVNFRTNINFTCNNGYTFEKKSISYFIAECESSKWVPEIPTCKEDSLSPRSFVSMKGKCPPIMKSHGTNVDCVFKRYGKVNCSKPAFPGTRAIHSCQEYYRLTDINEAVCQKNGKWSRTITCDPSCYAGAGVPLVVHGTAVTSDKKVFPWVAGLYVLEGNRWEYKCGATLISDNIIITAAHCVWEKNPNNLKISIGKLYRDFYKLEARQQNFYVKYIKLLSVYQDRNGNYGSDVALLILHSKVKLSTDIHPACILWDHDMARQITSPGSHGLVAGWGFTEDDKPSNELRYVSIPIVDSKSCINEEPVEFRKYVTYTSFCAGYKNVSPPEENKILGQTHPRGDARRQLRGTSVCNGDSGSGLVFNLYGIWYLEGLVSISPRRLNAFLCEPKLYSVFTKVDKYKRWILDTLKDVRTM